MAARRRLIPSPRVPLRPTNWRPGSALGWGPGFQGTSARPIPSLPPGLYRGKVTVPLTGGQAQSVISSGANSAALVQSAPGVTATSGTTLTLTLPSGTTAGNCLVVYVGAAEITTNPVVSGITLGGSGTNAVKAAQGQSSIGADAEVWIIWNIAGGQTSVVVTFTAGTGGGQGNCAYAEEWSGLVNTASPVDKSAGNAADSAAPSSGATATLTQAAELALGVISQNAGSSATITGPASPWVNKAQLNAGTTCGMIAGHQVLNSTAAQTYAGTFSATESWGAAVATMLANASGLPSGDAAVSVGPQGLGTIWYPAQVVVSTTSSLAGTDNSVCNVYLGSGAVPNTLLGTVIGGGILAAAVPALAPGQTLIAQWTGGNPGDVAAINVIGTMDALTV